MSPTKATPQKAGGKRPFAGIGSPESAEKAERTPKRSRRGESWFGSIKLQRPKQPVGEAWPVKDLLAFDAPTEYETDINFGPMLRDVLKERGWRYSVKPCHGSFDPDAARSTFHVKEFEASIRGQPPEKVFSKSELVEDGYRLQKVPLPKHALWMMTRLPFRVPGTHNERADERDDFVKIVVEHGGSLPGKAGNYRIAKFPGTETLLFKTHLTEAFKDKPWYPKTYILPKEKDAFLAEMRTRGNSRNNHWIGKPRNDYGGKGIRVYKGTDPELIKAVQDSDNNPRSLIQHYVDDTHLVGGYKYHMRIHLLITNVGGNGGPVEAFVQENGQCLFATKPYTLSSKTMGANFDPPVHVTNMGLNATPENKDAYFTKKPVVGRGQQIRVKQLVAHLQENDPTFDRQAFWQQILSIATDTANYVAQGIKRRSKTARDRHFELFGMDLMLDKDMKVWMCEVNTDPGLSYPDKEVLDSPNPDYQKELRACKDTLHDIFALLGLDAAKEQKEGSINHWFQLDFSETKPSNARAKMGA